MDTLKKLDKKSITRYAETLSNSFKGYPLFEHFFRKYKTKDVITFFRVALKADKNLIGFHSDHFEAVCICSWKGARDASILDFIFAGGLFYFFRFGFKSTMRMIDFSSYAGKIKRKYISDNDVYLYLIATLKEFRHQGFAAEIFRTMLDCCDKENKKCYLETLDKENTLIYQKFGFELVEQSPLPKSDLTLYCMLRNPKN